MMTRFKHALMLLMLATGTALATPATAATTASTAVRYDFQAFSSFPTGAPEDIVTGSFSVLLADFITDTVFIPASALTSCTARGSVSGNMTCRRQIMSKGSIDSSVRFQFFNPDEASALYLFGPNAMSEVGIHESIVNGPRQAGRLTVSLISAAVPEPATWAMMLIGFGAIGGALRARRRVSVSYG